MRSLNLYAPPLQPEWLRRMDFLEASRNYAGIAEGVASLVGAGENLITLDHTKLHERTSDGVKIAKLFALMEQV